MVIGKIRTWFLNRDDKYDVAICFLVVLQFAVIYLAYRINDLPRLFWFCNHTPFILALLLYFRKKYIIKGIINIGLIFQFLWTIDFISKALFGFYLTGTTRYLFEGSFGWLIIIPVLIHIFSTNLALYFTYDSKPNIKALFYSLIYIIVIYGITLSFTSIETNINCVRTICGVSYSFDTYTNYWPALAFFLIVIPTQLIQFVFYKIFAEKTWFVNK